MWIMVPRAPEEGASLLPQLEGRGAGGRPVVVTVRHIGGGWGSGWPPAHPDPGLLLVAIAVAAVPAGKRRGNERERNPTLIPWETHLETTSH